MRRMNGISRGAFMAGLGLLCALAQASGVKQNDTYAVQNMKPLVSPALIKEVGWTHNWQMNLPLKTRERIDRLGVFGPDLYVLTDSNVMFCIDRQRGRLRYTARLGVSELPVHRPFFYDNQYWFIIGNEMLVFDPRIGDFSIKERFAQVGSSAECGLARNRDYIYISGSDNRIHAIYAGDAQKASVETQDAGTDETNTSDEAAEPAVGFWEKFTATADNDSAIVSVQATDDIVVFATMAGNVVGMSPDQARKLWQFDATGQIKCQLVLDGQDIYFGSLDSKLYKLDLLTGRLDWTMPFHSGAPIRDTFTVGRDIIYLYNVLSGLYGVNKETGRAVWQVAAGKGMICETADKGFVYAEPGILKVMDNTSGQELYSVNLSDVEYYAHNTTDPVMYTADAAGRLLSVTVR